MKIGLTGRSGFLGSALNRKFDELGYQVFPYLRPDLDFLFLFGSPSSEVLFKKNIDWCFKETIEGFLFAISYCKKHKIKLIYPSSATVYNKATKYSRCKAALEEIHQAYGGDVLGFRIFAGYGPGEEHKGEYASIVYQFCKDIVNDNPPVVFGNGTQSRDFIFVNDIVNNIVKMKNRTGIIDLGTGISISFNSVVNYINCYLGKNVQPVYVNKPQDYIQDTHCKNPVKTEFSFEKGVEVICQKLLSQQQ